MIEIDVAGGIFRDLIFYGNRHSKDLLEIPGGTGYNVFAGLRALGVNVYFHANIGKDWPFEKDDGFNIVENEKSGVFVSLNEIEVLAVYRGANLHAKNGSLRSRILFSSLECGGNTFERYAKSMRTSNGIVILDPSPIFEWKDEYIELCDYLLPNEEEYSAIFGKNILPPRVKIFKKLGEKGAKYIEKNEEYYIPASQGGKFSLGCGDAFDAIVLYGLLNNKTPLEILKTAIEAGTAASFIKGSSTAVVEAIENVKHYFEL